MIKYLVSLVIAVLSGMGTGGGGLLVAYLTLFCEAEQVAAQGANLLFFLGSASASTLFSAKQGRIKWRLTFVMSAFGSAATVLGAMLVGAVSTDIIKKIFGAMLFITGIASILKKQ